LHVLQKPDVLHGVSSDGNYVSEFSCRQFPYSVSPKLEIVARLTAMQARYTRILVRRRLEDLQL